jgi:MraZ protein
MKSLFLSAYNNKVDKKGRVSIPSSFREVASKDGASSVIIFKSLTKECLEGCTISHIATLHTAISAFDPFSQEKDSFATAILAESLEIDFDKDGRINIPKHYLLYANIDENAVFVGKGATFEIWNPETFKKHSDECRRFAVENAKLIKWS